MSKINMTIYEAEKLRLKVVELRIKQKSLAAIADALGMTGYFIKKYLWFTTKEETKAIIDARMEREIANAQSERKRKDYVHKEVLRLVREVEDEFGSITNSPRNHSNYKKIQNLVKK